MFLRENWQTSDDPDAITLPTGVYIKSLRFINVSDVHISGYVWQRRTDGVHDQLSEGFIWPEQVNSLVQPREDYRVRMGEDEVIGYYFEGAFRHPYEYDDYPFDHKAVWIRLWPKDFEANVVLVPDFGAYPCPNQPELTCTGVNDTFGVEELIVLDEFERADTYYDYQLSNYNTNFGINQYVGQHGFPELRFNVLLRRSCKDAFIIYVIPIFVVAILTYVILMVTTLLETRTSRFGYSTFEVIAVITALIFVLVVSQGQIRERFPGVGFIYIEVFYYVMYLMLLFVAANAYLVSLPETSEWWVIRYGDNLIPKVTYWPFLLGILVVITILTL